MQKHGFNTLLFNSSEFQNQLKSLSYDRSVGIYKTDRALAVPDSFDGRSVWGKYMQPVRNQGTCGSCWAFATTFCLATRLSISTNGKYNFALSPSKMVLCNMGDKEMSMAQTKFGKGEPYDYLTDAEMAGTDYSNLEVEAVNNVGCHGSTIIGAWQFLQRFGVPEETCMQYNSSDHGQQDLSKYTEGMALTPCSRILGQFLDKCPSDGSPAIYHRAIGYYIVPGVASSSSGPSGPDGPDGPFGPDFGTVKEGGIASGSELDIRRDVYHWGPVSVGFTVYADFFEFFKNNPKGVYKWNGQGEAQGGHAVSIVGWGTDATSGMPYWQVRNSWGPDWGDSGYFKILRGSNHCGIEENVVAGLPNLFGYRLYLEWPLLYNSDDMALRAAWQVWYSGAKVTTLEAMVTGKTKPDSVALDNQYSPNSWPDVSVFVAGDPSTFKYRLAGGLIPGIGSGNMQPFVIGAVSGGLAVGAIGYLIYRNMLKRR
jgi:hypothetical protein